MTVKASSIKGLQIFSLSQSKNIGTAEDVVYDPQAKKIEAVKVKGGKAILINEIKSIGQDAIVLDSDQAIKKEDALPPNVTQLIKSNQKLPKSKVMTESGMNLGQISDLLFNPSTGMVEEMETSQGPIKDLESGKKTIKVSDIVSMNQEMTVVKSSAEQEVQKQSQEKGIGGMVKKLGSTVKEKTQEVKEKPEPTATLPGQASSAPKQQPDNPIEDLKQEGIEPRDEQQTKAQNQAAKPGKIEGVFKPAEKPEGSSGKLDENK